MAKRTCERPRHSLRGDAGVRAYAITLAAIGALIAAYHYSLQWLPGLERQARVRSTILAARYGSANSGSCRSRCVALAGFVAIIALLASRIRAQPPDSD